MSDFLANVRTEGEEIQLGTNSDEHKADAASPAEQANEGEAKNDGQGSGQAPSHGGAEGDPDGSNTQANQKEVPFNKHPRFREVLERSKTYEAENRQLKETMEAMARQQAEFFSRITPPKPPEPQKVPGWFSKAFGDDPTVWGIYQESMREQKEMLKREIMEEHRSAYESARVQEQEKQKQMDDWYESSLEAVVKDHGVDLKADKDLLNRVTQFAVEYKPTDDTGAISLSRAYALYSQMNKPESAPQTKEKKGISGMSMSKGSAASPQKDHFTSADLKNDWKTLVRQK